MTRLPRGVSLVELLVGLALGLTVLLAATTALQAASASHRHAAALGAMLDPLRFGMARLSRDLSGAGFFPHVNDPAHDVGFHPSVANIKPCWPTDGEFALPTTAVVAAGSRDGPVTDIFPCLRTSELQPGTDALLILRVAETAATERRARRTYLHGDGLRSLLFVAGDGTPPDWPGAVNHAFEPVLWYVRRYAHAPSEPDPTPALCRKVLAPGSPPRMQSDPAGCVADGIEDLQLELGVRDAPGSPLRFIAPEGAVDGELLSRTVAVRVHLVGRGPGPSSSTGTSVRIEHAALASRTHTDGRSRRLVSATISLRNAAWRLTMRDGP